MFSWLFGKRSANIHNQLGEDEEETMEVTEKEVEFLAKQATERFDFLTGKTKIFVCGGDDQINKISNSVESFNWPTMSWQQETEMTESRERAAAFVYGREIFVSGADLFNGSLNIESLNVDGNAQWIESNIKTPAYCAGPNMVRHKDCFIMTGGKEVPPIGFHEDIYSVQLTSPYETKSLDKLPEPIDSHASLVIDEQFFVFGGCIFDEEKGMRQYKDTVSSYSLRNRTWKTLTSLPYCVGDMAVVSYKSKAILIGGRNEDNESLDKVVMYDVKTGKSEMLPPLKYPRSCCAAVIAGDIIVVVGGQDGHFIPYDSVESLDLSANVWRELPPMIFSRASPAAVLSPIY